MELLAQAFAGGGGVLSSVIQFVVGPVLLLVLGYVLDRRNKRRVDSVKNEITNEHKDHLRDDLDSKFALVFAKLDHSATMQKKQGKVLIRLREDVATLFRNDAEQMKDVESLREEIAQRGG